jgi:hypothetical protein
VGSQGAVAALTFILFNAVKYDVTEDTLVKEIQQLGELSPPVGAFHLLLCWLAMTVVSFCGCSSRPAKGEQ